ncbi:MAG TPA: hypothetical protein VEO54_00525 [Thermoanaerobaculia bacterium]|nr:hypothetical protein [Thermoanaerobaculia bacterium]
MARAAVCIGVAKTGGGLPTLKVARSGAEQVHEWALASGIDSHLITDAEGPVTVKQLRAKIKELLAPSNLEQLIIYFSGHGVNIRREEYWLLSGAPDDDEAINVAAAETRARYCGVPHVVFLSDACRTAPADTQGQSIDGDPLFPNSDWEGLENKVDLFWACTLGAPSLEIKDPNDSAKRHAVFTDELIAALKGTYPEILKEAETPPAVVLRPWPLRDHLIKRVPMRVSEILGGVAVKQQPDARINSPETAWLARFETPPIAPAALESLGFSDEPEPQPPSIAEEARAAVRRAIAVGMPTREWLEGPVRGTTLRDAPSKATHCGFELRGGNVRAAFAEGIDVEIHRPRLVHVWPEDRAHDVLLELEDGRAVLLPVLDGFLATLTFEEGELRNVAYEPSDGEKREPLTRLRNLVAASAHVGGFHMEEREALELVRMGGGLDPTLALYAAYTCHNLGRRDLIRDLQQSLREELGVTLFDIALLADRKIDPQATFPLVPMLAQGWSLADAFGIALPEGLKKHVGPSLWTVFDHAAIPALRTAMRGRTA